MRKITESLDESEDKKYRINVLDVLCLVRQSWDQVPKSTIEKCFRNEGFFGSQVENGEVDVDVPISEVVAPGIDFNDYATCYDELVVCATEVIESVDSSETMNSDSDENDDEAPAKIVPFSQALSSLETVKTYLMQQEVNDVVFDNLHKVEKELFRVKDQGSHQTAITQFFVKM
nr:uncharacterized protein LOC122271844 [Parasteatoda tepidariorum]